MRNEADVDTVIARTLPWQRTGLPYVVIALVAIVADQLTKLAVVARFELYETVTLLPVLNFTYLQNPGAAFSFLAQAGGWQRWGFTALAVIVAVFIILWLRRLDGTRQRLVAIGLTLIMGGALGNVIDRLRFGYVIDFVHVHWKSHYFPAFNLADSCITIGAVLLFVDAFLEPRRKRQGAT